MIVLWLLATLATVSARSQQVPIVSPIVDTHGKWDVFNMDPNSRYYQSRQYAYVNAEPNATLSVQFYGTGITFRGDDRVLYLGSQDFGKATLVIDPGTDHEKRGVFAPTHATRSRWYDLLSIDGLDLGPHTAVVTVLSDNLMIQNLTIYSPTPEGYYSQWNTVSSSTFINGTDSHLVASAGWKGPDVSSLQTKVNGAHLDIRVPQNASYVSITGAATGPYSVNIDPVPSSLVNGNRTFHPFGISTPGYDYIPLFIADLDPHERYDITLTYLGADEDYLIYDEMESIVYNFSKEIKAAKSRKQKINIAIGCSVAAGVLILWVLCYFLRKREQRRQNLVADRAPATDTEMAHVPVHVHVPVVHVPAPPEVELPVDETFAKSLIPPRKGRTKTRCTEESSGECIVCQDNEATLAPVECGHLCLCDDCAARIVRMAPIKCPLCSAKISKPLIRIYRP